MKLPTIGIRRRCMAGILAGLAVAAVAGCSDGSGASRAPAESTAAVVQEACEFAGLVIPSNTTVLAADSASGMDTRYRIALSAAPAGVNEFLARSGIVEPLAEFTSVTERTIAGPPLVPSPSIKETGDRYIHPGGDARGRSVIVDERDPSTWFVHISVYDF